MQSNAGTCIRQLHGDCVSMTGIAKLLNAEGIAGKNGGRWYATTISKILANDLHTLE